MILGAVSSGVVSGGDFSIRVKNCINRLISYFADETTEEKEDQTEDNTSDKTESQNIEQNPPDLGITVEDTSEAGERFGP